MMKTKRRYNGRCRFGEEYPGRPSRFYRKHGPAMEWDDGHKAWYEHGKIMGSKGGVAALDSPPKEIRE